MACQMTCLFFCPGTFAPVEISKKCFFTKSFFIGMRTASFGYEGKNASVWSSAERRKHIIFPHWKSDEKNVILLYHLHHKKWRIFLIKRGFLTNHMSSAEAGKTVRFSFHVWISKDIQIIQGLPKEWSAPAI